MSTEDHGASSPEPPIDKKARNRKTNKLILKVAGVVVALFVVIGVLGAIFGGDDGGEAAPEKAAERPVASADGGSSDEPADTGRMSEGEFTVAVSAIDGVDGEIQKYADRAGSRCAALFTVGDGAAGLECIDDAYDGIEGALALAAGQLGDLRDDTGGKCRRALGIAANLANAPLFRAAQANKAAFDTLDGAQVTATGKRFGAERQRWSRASVNVALLCTPE